MRTTVVDVASGAGSEASSRAPTRSRSCASDGKSRRTSSSRASPTSSSRHRLQRREAHAERTGRRCVRDPDALRHSPRLQPAPPARSSTSSSKTHRSPLVPAPVHARGLVEEPHHRRLRPRHALADRNLAAASSSIRSPTTSTIPASPDAPVFDADGGYLDVTNKAFAAPQDHPRSRSGGDFPAC